MDLYKSEISLICIASSRPPKTTLRERTPWPRLPRTHWSDLGSLEPNVLFKHPELWDCTCQSTVSMDGGRGGSTPS